MNIELYIGDYRQVARNPEATRVDLFEDVNINITDSIKNARDVGSVYTAFSQQFRVPASKTNNKLFEHYYDVKVIDGFDARRKHPAIIKINGVNYKRGYIKLNGVDLKDNVAYAYRLQFFGEISSLKDRLGDDTLKNLTYLNYLNHPFDIDTVRDGFETGLQVTSGVATASSSGQVCYPFISHTRGFTYSTTDGLYDLTQTGTVTSLDRLDHTDLKPAIRVSEVMDAIGDKYNLSFTGTFLTDQVYTDLFIWCHGNKGGIETDDPQNNVATWEAYITELNLDSVTLDPSDPALGNIEVYDQINPNGPDWDKDYTDFTGDTVAIDPNNEYHFINYNAPGNFMKYDCSLDITPNGWSDDYYVRVWDENHGTVFLDTTAQSGTQNFTFEISDAATTAGNPRFKLRNIKIRVMSNNLQEFDIDWEFEGNRDAFNTSIRTRTWQYSRTVSAAELITEVRVPYNLPNMKCIDFLTALFKLFNLVAYAIPESSTGTNMEIRIEAMDYFYDNGKAIDITNYVDISESTVERVAPYNRIGFKFEESSTYLAIKTNELSQFEFGNASYTTGDFGSNSSQYLFDGGEYEVKTGLEKMVFERIEDEDDNTPSQIIYGWFVNDFSENTPEPELGKPLFFYRVNRSCSTDTIEWSDSTSSTVYNAPSNVIADQSQTLNFGADYDEYTGFVNEESLYANYYDRYIRSIYDPNARRVKVTAYLPPQFIFNYTLADKLVISGTPFQIESIDINLVTGRTTLELLRATAVQQQYKVETGGSYADTGYVEAGYWDAPVINPKLTA